MREYTAYLSGDSFRDTANRIRAFRDNIQNNIKTFCEELAKEGEIVIRAVLSEHVDTAETIGSVEIVSEGDGGTYIAKVQVTSDAIMFLEFGSGLVGLNGEQHPYGVYGPGTFGQAPRQNPEYDNWENPEGWFYKGNDGNYHKSFGMEASMPMYKGGEAMREKLHEVAKRVFGHA